MTGPQRSPVRAVATCIADARTVAGWLTVVVSLTAMPLVAQSPARPAGARPTVLRPTTPGVLAAARQLVLVSADGWDATGGTLRRYARVSPRAAWEPVGDPVRVTLGRTGMAWGVGQGARPDGAPTKREGDGRSPAGAYALLHTFGTAPTDAAPSTYPHLPLRAGTVCVDDPGAATYNAIVDGDTTGRGAWASGERMWRVAGYRLGVVVAYNGARTRAGGVRAAAAGARPVPGRGSCIFLHVWDGPDRTTEGCTAMEATALAAVVAWLDPRARPALVQLPASVASGYAGRWALP